MVQHQPRGRNERNGHVCIHRRARQRGRARKAREPALYINESHWGEAVKVQPNTQPRRPVARPARSMQHRGWGRAQGAVRQLRLLGCREATRRLGARGMEVRLSEVSRRRVEHRTRRTQGGLPHQLSPEGRRSRALATERADGFLVDRQRKQRLEADLRREPAATSPTWRRWVCMGKSRSAPWAG